MPAYGLFPTNDFLIAEGACADTGVLPQALWYFRHETIAVPETSRLVTGFSPALSLRDDLSAWAMSTPVGRVVACPPLIWLAAPVSLSDVQIAADGRSIMTANGQRALALVPKLPLNGAYFNAESLRFFHGQPLKMRGNERGEAFVARTVWPQNFRLPEAPACFPLPAEPAAFRAWLRAVPQGGAQTEFSVESVWRRPGVESTPVGRPVIGLMLNGAQGDDDEAHGGHFALMTGRIGEQGAIDDWLVNNFYSLDAESEKGIIAAPVPLDNYLGDLNSGQSWYRPAGMLAVVLKQERTAVHLQSALSRVYALFYRHQFAYRHASANCTGISVTTLRQIGWQVPVRGAESWLKAAIGLPWIALKEWSLAKGKLAFDYLTEDQTRLYPAAAFEEMGADLLNLANGQAGRHLSEFEALLAEDIEEILLVRLPQFPSDRAWGDFPVVNSGEYAARLPKDPAQQKIIPVPPRPFPAELRDPQTPAEPLQRSDYALAAWILLFVLLILFILRRLLA